MSDAVLFQNGGHVRFGDIIGEGAAPCVREVVRCSIFL